MRRDPFKTALENGTLRQRCSYEEALKCSGSLEQVTANRLGAAAARSPRIDYFGGPLFLARWPP
jgi:hypothetical protein